MIRAVWEDANAAESTKWTRIASVRQFLRFAGDGPWTSSHVVRWRNQQVQGGIARSTVNSRVAALRSASALMRQQGLGPDFAAEVTDRLAVVKDMTAKADRALEPDELERLFAACPIDGSAAERRDRCFVALGAWQGLRESEMARLRWEQLSVVADGPPGWMLHSVKGKGNRIDDVRLHAPTLQALAAWRISAKTAAHGPMFHALPPRLDGPPRALSESSIYKALVGRARAAGLSSFTVHDLRHTFIMGLLRAGVSPELVRLLARHSSYDVTFRNYVKMGAAERLFDVEGALSRSYAARKERP